MTLLVDRHGTAAFLQPYPGDGGFSLACSINNFLLPFPSPETLLDVKIDAG